jgi:hypothetical protein
MDSFSSVGCMSKLNKSNLGSRTILGLSGVASSGKDTFFSLLSQKLPFERFALADELKILLREDLIKKHNVDILNCTREEKDLVRNDLVLFAKQKRLESYGKFWTDILTKKILDSKSQYICITDIRHNYFSKDEVFWLKHVLNGRLIDVSCYNPNNGAKVQPPNEEESFHYPKVREDADYYVIWPKVSDIKVLDLFVNQCILDLHLK